MTESKLFSWLHQNYTEDKSESLLTDDLISACQEKFGNTTIDRKAIGRYVISSFPSVTKVKQRRTGDWTKYQYVYKGLGKRNHTTDKTVMSFTKISSYVPSGFFVLESFDHLLRFGKSTDLQCNGNRVIMEVELSDVGQVNIFLGGKSVISHSGICDQVSMDRVSIDGLLASLSAVRFCQGVVHKTFPTEQKENNVIQKNSDNEYVVYSTSCHKILNFNCFKSTTACTNCRTVVRHLSHNAATCVPDNLVSHEPTSTDIDVPNYENQQTNASQSDVISILMEKAPYLSSSQLKLIQAQLQNSSVNDKHSRRWDSDIIQLTLSLWTRSRKTYEQLLKSGCLVLPSISTLSRYKNVVEQHAGTNNDVFKWMYMESCSGNLPKHGYYGGLVLDEMSIQEDLQIVKKGGQIKLVGFPDIVKSSNGDTSFANHVLQYVFHGFTGFRFPIAHFPTTQANAPQLYSSFWDIISSLESWGFHVLYVSIDGASTNRNFIKLHFDGSPGQFDMATHNPFSDNPVIFLADPSHLFKKIRNNLLKSGPEKLHSRELTINGHPIVWKMWIDSYEWDKQHGLSIHHKLGNDHIHPNKADLMRNHLAEEVLDSNMLSLMRSYKQNLGHGSSVLEGAVDLLEQTSTLISIFHDRRPIRDLTDIRLHQLRTILQWFRKWEESETRQHLMSWETREDVEFLLSGFCKLAHVATQDLKITLTPLYINSDIVENHFSQQRGLYHGSGANPNYNQYRTATNSIILGQSTISNKSNASMRNTLQSTGAMPFSHLCKQFKV